MSVSSRHRPNCCVVYTTDQTYLFPTFVSAIQARRYSSQDKADIIIIGFDLGDEAYRLFLPICKSENICLSRMDSSLIEQQSAMMARIFLHRLVPEQYSDCLYLDGDVHISGSLDALLDAQVPDGHFLAANDPITFLLADMTFQSRDLNRYLGSLGLTPDQSLRYFNSGVLRIKMSGWEEIGRRAWQYFHMRSRRPRFQDQDALNVVAGDQRLPMSLAWNYPVFMRHSRVESSIRPRIKHFMSSPKPWHGAFPPWTREACRPYADALAQYPSLVPFNLSMALHSRAIYQLQQRAKQLSETVMWGWSKRRARILQYEDACLSEGAP